MGCLQDLIPVESIIERGRLRPGQIFLVNLIEGKIIRDKELKKTLSTGSGIDYREWSNKMVKMEEVLAKSKPLPKEEVPMLT